MDWLYFICQNTAGTENSAHKLELVRTAKTMPPHSLLLPEMVYRGNYVSFLFG